MLIDGLEWCGLLVDYCDVFISCLDSHSDGTHSLQRIHQWASKGMLHFSKSDEETNSSTSWMADGECIFSKFKFLGELFLFCVCPNVLSNTTNNQNLTDSSETRLKVLRDVSAVSVMTGFLFSVTQSASHRLMCFRAQVRSSFFSQTLSKLIWDSALDWSCSKFNQAAENWERKKSQSVSFYAFT